VSVAGALPGIIPCYRRVLVYGSGQQGRSPAPECGQTDGKDVPKVLVKSADELERLFLFLLALGHVENIAVFNEITQRDSLEKLVDLFAQAVPQ
jgi:hypothetical protein